MTAHVRRAVLLALIVTAVGAITASAEGPTANPAGMRRLSDEKLVTKWAYAAYRGRVYTRPVTSAHAMTHLRLLTEDNFPQPYVVLADWRDAKRSRWLKIRLPGRPNGRTGWVADMAMGDLSTVHTRLVINRGTLRVTLYEHGKRIFRAPIGVGKSSTRTPAGRFWVTEKFRVRSAPVYGTRAIGTSAYAPGLTDWPGGGVVGMHGTNQPGLIPGRPSHGCIRLKNAAINRLYRLVPKGTPIRIL
ncbi:MAG: L,D-transpeptidase [Actinomycetota bacterium]|nr:L,D-transpeptidase [Actinomycetota bacterium]